MLETCKHAQKPTISLVYPNGFSILALTAPFCGFDTIDTPEPGKPLLERIIQFANGGAIIAGPLFVQLQNTTTGQIIDLSSTGPAPSVTFSQDGGTLIIGGGLSIWNYTPPPLSVTEAAGLPPIPYTKGRVKVVFDATGNITFHELAGHGRQCLLIIQLIKRDEGRYWLAALF